MNETLRVEVDAMITNRILTYHQGLIEAGQIREFAAKPPGVSRPVSDCSQSGHMPVDVPREGLSLLRDERPPSQTCDSEMCVAPFAIAHRQ